MTSEALQALYEGELDRARELLPRDEDLSVFEAAAFGRIDRLAAILDDDPSQASAFSPDGFTALHLAVFAEELEAARLLIERGADVSVRSTSEVARVPPLGRPRSSARPRSPRSCWVAAPTSTARMRAASRHCTPLRPTATSRSSGSCSSTAPTRRSPTRPGTVPSSLLGTRPSARFSRRSDRPQTGWRSNSAAWP